MSEHYYIRTDTNIFEVVDENEKVYQVIPASRDCDKVYSKSKLATNVIKSGKTIEELCDERVLTRYFDETKYTHHEVLPIANWDFMAKSVAARLENGITDCNYYGAIWTSKELKYVAKLNKYGDLELI